MSSKWIRQERTDEGQGDSERDLLSVGVQQEVEQQQHTGEAAAEKMRERINTFETVLNMDQFLVRLTTR